MSTFNPQKIIAKKIKKDYPEEKIIGTTYSNLEKILSRNLRKKNKSDLYEIRLDTDMRIQKVELTDFDKFINIRIGYYAMALAIIAIIASSQELLSEFSFTVQDFLSGIMFCMLLLIISHNVISSNQKKDFIYYKFKLKCIDKVISENEGNSVNKKNR